jgi:hypothetical protein
MKRHYSKYRIKSKKRKNRFTERQMRKGRELNKKKIWQRIKRRRFYVKLKKKNDSKIT